MSKSDEKPKQHLGSRTPEEIRKLLARKNQDDPNPRPPQTFVKPQQTTPLSPTNEQKR